MKKIKGRRPSPSMVVAVTALIVALAGTAVAAGPLAIPALNKGEKKKVKKIATNKANQAINQRAPGLSVAHANTANSANNAGLLDGVDSTGFVQVGTRARQVTTGAINNYAGLGNLLQLSDLAGGEWVVRAVLDLENDNASPVQIDCDLFLVPVNVELDMRTIALGNAGDGDRQTMNLQDLVTTNAAGTDDVRIRCTNPNADADADHLSIIATKVNN